MFVKGQTVSEYRQTDRNKKQGRKGGKEEEEEG